MTRHSISYLVPAILAFCAAGSAAALDHEQAQNPLIIGGPAAEQSPYFLGITGGVESKAADDGFVFYDDAAIFANAKGRAYGVGLGIQTEWALGQAPDISRPGFRVNPGELLRLAGTLDAAFEISNPSDPTIPMLQFIPHFTVVTYPYQRDMYGPFNDNFLKDKQRWLGVDGWWMVPWAAGVELGAGFEQNASSTWRAFRAGVGAREFVVTSGVDFALWQTLGLGDSEYRGALTGVNKSGVTTFDVGARATTNSIWKGLQYFAQVDISYWVSKEVRDNLRDAGIDGGNVTLAIGLEWTPE